MVTNSVNLTCWLAGFLEQGFWDPDQMCCRPLMTTWSNWSELILYVALRFFDRWSTDQLTENGNHRAVTACFTTQTPRVVNICWKGHSGYCSLCAPPCCCDVRCVYGIEIGLHGFCPSFWLEGPFHCTFPSRRLFFFRVQSAVSCRIMLRSRQLNFRLSTSKRSTCICRSIWCINKTEVTLAAFLISVYMQNKLYYITVCII